MKFLRVIACIIFFCFFNNIEKANAGIFHHAKSFLPAPNSSPVANAGPDQNITNPLDSILLDGSASYDSAGTIVLYQWTYVGDPYNIYQFADSDSVVVRVRDLKVGTYIFKLTITDNLGDTASDTMSVVVNIMPTPPPTDTDVINCGHAFTIVVLGSSTAYGLGAVPIDSSWVNKYTAYAKEKDSNNTVIDLGVPGYTTYQVLCPDNFVPPVKRPAPDTAHNITAALNLHPDAIIINLPTNDVANNYTLAEQQANYARAIALIDSANIPVWVTTTQPRDSLPASYYDSLEMMRDWTYNTFGNKALDFWTTVADTNGMIVNVYDFDGTHVNNYGHYIFFTRVVGAKILDSMCNRFDFPVPSANAGNDTSINLPYDSLALNGSASSANGGTIANFLWREISGPAQYNITDSAAEETSVTNLEQGSYQFQLIVTNTNGNADSSNVTININPEIVLATQLTEFSGMTVGNSIKLIWNVTSDQNINKYLVQKSADGINFDSLGFVLSNHANRLSTYYYNDNAPFDNFNFYRLKIYNDDNSATFSGIIKINIIDDNKKIFVYPNPVDNDLIINLNGAEAGQYILTIINDEGEKVISVPVICNTINSTINTQLPVSMPSGIYQALIESNQSYSIVPFMKK